MKLFRGPLLFLVIASLEGCVSLQNTLVLDAVGPAPAVRKIAGTNGVLVVYSAFDPYAHFSGVPYRRYHTDYKILAEDARLLQIVHNDVGGVIEDPKPVKLQAGRYRILARANGYGWVTVPVVIVAHEITTVHLEGGSSWPKDEALVINSVRFPDGRIAGWRAGQ